MLKPSDHIVKGTLKVIKGSVCRPQSGGLKYVVQVVNDAGKYGAGVSGAISKAWPKVESEYRGLWRMKYGKLKLGDVQFIQVASDLIVVNMIGKHDIVSSENPVPIKYDALQACLAKVGIEVSDNNGTVHMPRIGCGLAGGTWDKVGPIVEQELQKRGINVFVYELE